MPNGVGLYVWSMSSCFSQYSLIMPQRPPTMRACHGHSTTNTEKLPGLQGGNAIRIWWPFAWVRYFRLQQLRHQGSVSSPNAWQRRRGLTRLTGPCLITPFGALCNSPERYDYWSGEWGAVGHESKSSARCHVCACCDRRTWPSRLFVCREATGRPVKALAVGDLLRLQGCTGRALANLFWKHGRGGQSGEKGPRRLSGKIGGGV